MHTIHSRPLDFIVFGVPRSGTKALARALNLHPNVYCSFERFTYDADHTSVVFPDSFLETRDLHDRHRLNKRDRTAQDLARRTDVRHAGNKTPRYYLALERLNTELPRLKNLWIYRSPAGFMQSWNRKEANHRTSANWQRGQVGLFGMLELLSCLHACAHLGKDIFVFPYQAGLNRSTDPIKQALAFLGADPATFDRATFVNEHLPKRRDDRRRLPLLDHEQDLLDTLHVTDLDRILDQPYGFMVSTVRQDLRDYLALARDRLPAAIDQTFEGYRDPAVFAYGAAYFHQQRRERGWVVEMTRGSTVVANLQRYTVPHRLRSLHLQRRALTRRLARLRLPL